MKILCGYAKDKGQLNQGYEGYIEGLRKLGHDVPDSFDMCVSQQMPRSGFDFFLQFDCCDFYSNPQLEYPTIYWAYDTWQNYTNNRQKGYHGDGNFCRMEYYVPRAKMATHVFNMSVLGVENMRHHGINSHWLPIGADERLERKPGSQEKIYSVAALCSYWHMGHLNDERGRLTAIIQDKYRQPERGGNSFITQKGYFEQADIYAQSRIGWNYSPGGGFDVLNFRVFEVMIAGTCLLTNDNVIPSLGALGYVPFTDYWPYRDETDLMESIAYLLANDKERERIALSGYNKTKFGHTMRHRMQKMFEVAGFNSTIK